MNPKQILVAVGTLALIALNFFVGTGGHGPFSLSSTQLSSVKGVLLSSSPSTQLSGTLQAQQGTTLV